MTVRLDYTNAYLTAVTGIVRQVTSVDDRPALMLDQSCFYPTSGGQPHDTGKLAGQRVIDVRVDDDGHVLHMLDALPASLEPGTTVTGEIDWPRRYDHMQQHSGQHLLSAVFADRLGAETVSVHFGQEISAVELDTPRLTSEEIAQAEQAVNERIWENRPIRVYMVSDAEAAELPLRRAPAVTGQIRIVEIEQLDYSACGGTHVRRTGEIGLVKLVGVENIRGRVRVSFLCGRRALNDYVRKSRLAAEIGALFSTDAEEAPALITRLQGENKQLQRDLAAAGERLAAQEAAALCAQAPRINTASGTEGGTEGGSVKMVAHLLDSTPPAGLTALARQLQALPGVVALLAGVYQEKVTAIFARSDDVTLDAGALLRRSLQEFGGGGGGRPDFAQGGGVAADDAAALIAFAREQAEKELSQP